MFYLFPCVFALTLCLLSVILGQATCKLSAEENLLELKGETIVVGDLHGQFFDLMKILQTYGQVRFLI